MLFIASSRLGWTNRRPFRLQEKSTINAIYNNIYSILDIERLQLLKRGRRSLIQTSLPNADAIYQGRYQSLTQTPLNLHRQRLITQFMSTLGASSDIFQN